MADCGEGRTLEEDILQRFRDITLLDNETAKRFLCASQWDIDDALNTYLTTNDVDVGTAANPLMIPDSPEMAPSASRVQISNNTQLNDNCHMKLLTWNIDGLCEEQIRERTRYVCFLIKSKQPDVVYLQEVVEQTLSVFKRQFPEFLVLHDNSKVPTPYFNVIMLKQATIKPLGELQCKQFTTSTMGRHLLIQPAQFCDIKLVLMTSHLESTGNCHQERKKQLSEVFSEMTMQNPEHLVVFGGDTNLRDKEVSNVGLPLTILDMWEACGSEDATKFTWDTNVNDNLNMPWKSKLRFDRVYLRNGSWRARISLLPCSFSLVGKERLASGCFPSDHWGIWCEFNKLTK